MTMLRRPKRGTLGFTLVELMVCVAIFAVITLAVQEVFSMVIKLWRTGDARLKMFQNARFALEVIGVHTRSSMRPDMVDYDRDGDIDAVDTGVTGARFVIVNYAAQSNASSNIIDASTKGIGYGYNTSDAMAHHSYGYHTDWKMSDWSCFAYGMQNVSPATNGNPVIYLNKLNNNSVRETWRPIVIRPNINDMLPFPTGGGGNGTQDPTFYAVQDFQLEAFWGTTASGSGYLYWDTAHRGKLPTMVKMWILAQDEKGIAAPVWLGTCISLTPATGMY